MTAPFNPRNLRRGVYNGAGRTTANQLTQANNTQGSGRRRVTDSGFNTPRPAHFDGYKGKPGWFHFGPNGSGTGFINAKGNAVYNAKPQSDPKRYVSNPLKLKKQPKPKPFDPHTIKFTDAPWEAESYFQQAKAGLDLDLKNAGAKYDYEKKLMDDMALLMRGAPGSGGGEIGRAAERDFYAANASQAARGIHSSGMRETTDLRRKQDVDAQIAQVESQYGAPAVNELGRLWEAVKATDAANRRKLSEDSKDAYLVENTGADLTKGPRGFFKRGGKFWFRNAAGDEAMVDMSKRAKGWKPKKTVKA